METKKLTRKNLNYLFDNYFEKMDSILREHQYTTEYIQEIKEQTGIEINKVETPYFYYLPYINDEFSISMTQIDDFFIISKCDDLDMYIKYVGNNEEISLRNYNNICKKYLKQKKYDYKLMLKENEYEYSDKDREFLSSKFVPFK
jgi:hypothetical protein